MKLVRMRAVIVAIAIGCLTTPFSLQAQVVDDADGNFDETSYVETNSTTNSNSTVNSTNANTNTNNNTSTSTNTNTNNNTNTNANTNNNTTTYSGTNNNTNTNANTNINTSTNTNTNTNNNVISGGTTNTNNNVMSGGTTNTNTNTNNNTSNSTVDQTVNSTSDSTVNQTVNSTSNNTNTNANTNTNSNTNNNTNNTNVDSNSNNTNNNNNTNDSTITQKIIAPPPSAIAPTVNAGGNDTCTTSISGAVQTQIIGVAGGTHVRDMNCEALKLSKTLYNMGMKVAAVSLLCQDVRVYKSMEMAGTPCPFDGSIGEEALAKWNANPEQQPVAVKEKEDKERVVTRMLQGAGASLLLLLLL